MHTYKWSWFFYWMHNNNKVWISKYFISLKSILSLELIKTPTKHNNNNNTYWSKKKSINSPSQTLLATIKAWTIFFFGDILTFFNYVFEILKEEVWIFFFKFKKNKTPNRSKNHLRKGESLVPFILMKWNKIHNIYVYIKEWIPISIHIHRHRHKHKHKHKHK